MLYTIVVNASLPDGRLSTAMSPTWIWLQIAIVVFVLVGMVVAIVKLA
jgi:hypothetical protein